jgi:hypothetical protein
MRKLRLDVSALHVESFVLRDGRSPDAGTVRGNAESNELCSEQKGCSAEESCAVTACLTCLCPHTGPQPSCDPCSWQDCFTFDVDTCP